MNNFFDMALAMLTDANNYEQRKVADKVTVDKFTISSCYTSDMGYETAICYGDEVYPVERYEDKESCIKGHNKWIEWAKQKPTQIPYINFDNEIEEEIEVKYEK